MPSLNDYYQMLQESDDFQHLPFDELAPDNQTKLIQPAVDYHNAMNNVYMSGPAREGRETVRTKMEPINTGVGTMFPTFPDIPKTDDYNITYNLGEMNQINSAFRDATGISNEQSQARVDTGRDPNMIPGFKLLPNPDDFRVINNAAGRPAMPVDVRPTLFSDTHQTGILEDLKAFAGIFK